MIDQPHDASCDCLACKYAVLARQERFDRPTPPDEDEEEVGDAA